MIRIAVSIPSNDRILLQKKKKDTPYKRRIKK